MFRLWGAGSCQWHEPCFAYVEMNGEMCPGLMVLKMRGSLHLKQIREFNIDEKGIHIGKPIHDVSGILAGKPVHVSPGEIERLSGLFQAEK